MTEKTDAEEIAGILEGLDLYLHKLEWFPGNAALKWLAESATRTEKVAKDRKQVIKNVNEMINYIDELPWAESNAAMSHAKSELKKCLEIYGLRQEEPEPEPTPSMDPEYDPPNPQPTEPE